MKTIAVPKVLHEVFGKKVTVVELVWTLLFGIGMSIMVLASTYAEWKSLAWWQIVVISLFALDINGGVIANITLSTNRYYQRSFVARVVFIALHVQPLLLALVLGGYWSACLFVWGYTLVAALLVNALVRHPAQRVIAAVLASFGIGVLILFFVAIPTFLLVTLLFFLLKVVYSFAVDHYAEREA